VHKMFLAVALPTVVVVQLLPAENGGNATTR
jgi:hypothetical protein